jgi:hypothetical protein
MDPRFFRNYANLIEAAERDEPAMQLDEAVRRRMLESC